MLEKHAINSTLWFVEKTDRLGADLAWSSGHRGGSVVLDNRSVRGFGERGTERMLPDYAPTGLLLSVYHLLLGCSITSVYVIVYFYHSLTLVIWCDVHCTPG